jgi:hypothetical protein
VKKILYIVAAVICAGSLVSAQEMAHTSSSEMKAAAVEDMGFHSLSETKWKNGPASLAAGAKMAVLEGDPSKEGPFVMRLSLPDGFKVLPHWHPKVERVTVLSGSFNLGMGEKFDQAATREMTVGTFGYWPAGMRHFAWAKGETVLQLHGIGPWVITYVNPADDPRNPPKPAVP